MSQEHLYASFLLDRQTGLEIAVQADRVIEAIPVAATIQHLPSSIDFLEGIMQLRDDIIPVINLKRRFGLSPASYDDDAKVAVIQLQSRRYGLLFDDIKEVLRVPENSVEPLDPLLMTEDAIISALIKLDQGARTLELLDLDRLFLGRLPELADTPEVVLSVDPATSSNHFRYVVFTCVGQEYGIPVESAREICFLSEIDETFQSGVVEGALELRCRTIPVLNGHQLLGSKEPVKFDELTRILVMQTVDLFFGIIVDQIREIIVVEEKQILSMPGKDNVFLRCICQYTEQRNILLLDVEELLGRQIDKVKSMTKLRSRQEEEQESRLSESHHLITENCYLIFSIGKNFAIELRDVQEILEPSELLSLPGHSGIVHGVINLRGMIVPVLDLHQFYSCPNKGFSGQVKLIIGRVGGQLLALIVDEIVTIYKQEEFHATPSLRPELHDKKDTLDRLIEFVRDDHMKEHVLVINIKNILQNHLCLQVESRFEDDTVREESDQEEQVV